MPIFLKCRCGQSLQARDADAGKHVRCPACAAVLAVPGAANGLRPSAPVRLHPPSSAPGHPARQLTPAGMAVELSTQPPPSAKPGVLKRLAGEIRATAAAAFGQTAHVLCYGLAVWRKRSLD